MVLTPTQPLAPGVEYEVVDRRPDHPLRAVTGSLTCALGAITVVGSFTTAAGPDSQPPPAPAGASLMARPAGPFGRCEAPARVAVPVVRKRYFARWSESGSGGAFLYNVYDGDSAEALVRLLRGNQLPARAGLLRFR